MAATNPTITAASADNRGQVQLTFDQADRSNLVGSSFNKNSVQMYEAGNDGHLGTADDLRISPSIRYTASNGRLLVRANVPAGIGYRIKIVSSRVSTVNGGVIDGDFKSNGTSGNGTAGGNYEMQVKNIKTSTPTVRMSTSAGAISLQLRGDLVAATVNNFLSYANNGRYDNTFIHRSGRTEASPIAIVQGGGYTNLSTGTHVTQFDPIPLQAGYLSNLTGTIAMARTSVPASATSEFFFNTADNTFLDPSGGGTSSTSGYAVFGKVTAGMDTVNAIYAANTTVVGPFNNVPQVGGASVSIGRVAVASKVAAL